MGTPPRRAIRVLVLLLLGGALLRAASALVMELHPVFPDFYFTDARMYHRQASDMSVVLSHPSAPFPEVFPISHGRELYTTIVASIYALLGPHPLLPSLMNILLTLFSLFLWYLIGENLAGPRPALLLIALLALWPTHVFYTSQNLKEAIMLLFLSCTVYSLNRALPLAPSPARFSASALAVTSAGFLFLNGFVRSHMLPMLAMAMTAYILCWAWLRRRSPGSMTRAVLFLALIFGATALFRPASARLFKRFHAPNTEQKVGFILGESPNSYSNVAPPFLSPLWISRFRWMRQESDRVWARKYMGRDIRTQLFPDLRLETWGDFIVFLPKGMFYVLFMPLPGFSSADGRLGPRLAAMENILILALFCFAVSGLRRRWERPLGACLLVYFLLSWVSLAFFEFDLGSASRHRLIYLPFLLPFAALEIDRILCRWSPRWAALDAPHEP